MKFIVTYRFTTQYGSYGDGSMLAEGNDVGEAIRFATGKLKMQNGLQTDIRIIRTEEINE